MPACVELPSPPNIPLPFPFEASAPPIQTPGFTANVCCKIVALKAATIPIPIPAAVVNPAFVAGLRKGLKAVAAYKAQIPVSCPRSSV